MLERELEDWLFAHAEDAWPYPIKVTRQVDLAHGRADILVLSECPTLPGLCHWLFVVELKRGPLVPKDVAQVLQYQYDVFSNLCAMYEVLEDPYTKGNGYALLQERLYGDDAQCLVRAELIGHSIDDKTLCIAEAAGVWVRTWEEHEGGIVLDYAIARRDLSIMPSSWLYTYAPLIEKAMDKEAESDENTKLAKLFMGDDAWNIPFVVGRDE